MESKYNPVPPQRTAGFPQLRSSSTQSLHCLWNCWTEKSSQGSQISTILSGTFRSLTGVFAVPMSIPRYTCIESTETTSPLRLEATASESELLPEAVGPTRAITGPGKVIGGRPRSCRANTRYEPLQPSRCRSFRRNPQNPPHQAARSAQCASFRYGQP